MYVRPESILSSRKENIMMVSLYYNTLTSPALQMATLLHPGEDRADQVAEGTKECVLLLCQVMVVFVVLVVVVD